jgi:hypothetical protein
LLPGTSRSIVTLLLCAVAALSLAAQTTAATPATLLNAVEAAKAIPATVFFRGQVASVQARNSGGVKRPDGMLVLCALVDTSGYSSAVQQKYQAYFITEVALDIQGQTLKPGAYGVGFLEGNRFLVMDLGGHDLFTTGSIRDAQLKRPTPLQVVADAAADHFRLYINRNYVVFSLPAAQ